MALIWEIVGGADKGGILVREGQAVSAAKCEQRLSTGAKVKQLQLDGDRLHYKLLIGSGPAEGWISVKLKDKDLAVKSYLPEEKNKDFDKDMNAPGAAPVAKAATATKPVAPKAAEESGSETALGLYLQACRVSGGAKGITAEGEELYLRAASAAPASAATGAAAKRVLELIALSSAYSQEVARVVPPTGDAFDSLLAFYRCCVSRSESEPTELAALSERKCIGKVRPEVAMLGMQFFDPESKVGPLCVECYLAHAGRDGAAEQVPSFAPSRCSSCRPDAKEAAPGGRDDELEEWIRAAVAGSGRDCIPSVPAGWPLTWRILAHHIRELRELSQTGNAELLGAAQCAQLRELHIADPAIKLHTYVPPAKSGPSRLVVFLHGGMQTARHLQFMNGGILGVKPLESKLSTAVLGVEADFSFESMGAGLSKPQAGFNYLRFTTIFGRIGELILSAARVYWQCIDAHVAAHPECQEVDLVGFSAGGLLTWIIFLMAEQSPKAWRFSTLSMMSPRLEDMLVVQDSFIKAHFKAHNARVYLGWGEYEDLKEIGAPFSAMASSLKKWLPLNRLKTKMYPKVWHTMPPQQLEDVRAFLEASWK
mmetsp:Transcript_57647/g.106065  ORF Transcript_57647/g.106065 Transcript_57647/m.106065 type:complete len:595 (+) Transcript_57647:63-1847(+)